MFTQYFHIETLRRRVAEVQRQASGPQGSHNTRELCAVCDSLLQMVAEMTRRIDNIDRRI